MNDQLINKSLLPEFIKKPVVLFWTAVLPQLILLFINLRAYWLISEEVAAENISIAYNIFAFQIIMILLAIAVWLFSKLAKRNVHLAWNGLFLLGSIGYLWYFGWNSWVLIPVTIEPWMLDQGILLVYQFTFVMPCLFYSGVRLACFETKLTPKADFGWSFLLAVLGPVMYYFFFLTSSWLSGLFRHLRIPEAVGIIFFITMTVIAFVGLIRVIVLVYNTLRSKGDLAQTIFAVFIALAGPVFGLLLNKVIPFPADFQSVGVYVLAVINGLVVILPSFKKSDNRSYLLLFARSLTFPFSFYFFLVFLPFLPLSLPAMFAAGSGFLFLVPVVLFFLHSKKLYDDCRICIQMSRVSLTALLVLVGFLILPGYFVLEAFYDKGQLNQALRYTYSPDYSKDYAFTGSVKRVTKTLVSLRDFKNGIQLPYLSSLYNKVVFEGMVLPDRKIEYMYKLFSGEDFPQRSTSYFWARGPFSGSWRAGMRPPERDRNVELSLVDISTKDENGITASTMRLEMHNLGESDFAEFVREIYLPQGVLITGFELKVEDEMVPGQIFEKRAAMWVYHMIRDFTERDPGILTYKSPRQVNLNVFPFAKDQTRILQIEFQFPQGFSPQITIGDQSVELSENSPQDSLQLEAVQMVCNDNKFVVLSEEYLVNLPRFRRNPYLHFILDFSKDTALDNTDYLSRILSVAKEYSHVEAAKITAANFNLEDVSGGFIELDNQQKIADSINNIQLSHQGRLDVGRVIKQELKGYADKYLDQTVGDYWQYYPLFVVVTNESTQLVGPDNMEFFKPYLPDYDYFLVSSAEDKMHKHLLWEVTPRKVSGQVSVLRSGSKIAVVPADSGQMQIACFDDSDYNQEIFVYNSEYAEFEPVGDIDKLPERSTYTVGMNLIAGNYDLLTNPAEFDSNLSVFVSDSREAGVMIPSTSYIVVERSSQWKMLSLKEKQRLRASQGLEFEEHFDTPAPSIWVLLILFVIILLIRAKTQLSLSRGTK